MSISWYLCDRDTSTCIHIGQGNKERPTTTYSGWEYPYIIEFMVSSVSMHLLNERNIELYDDITPD